jgi:fucose permease
MTEPATTTTSTALISAFSITALFPNIDPGAILGALCGATLLIVGRNEFGRVKSVALFFVSFLMGILFADLMTTALCYVLPQELSNKTPLSLGALFVSILATQLLLLIMKQDLASLIKIIRGKL